MRILTSALAALCLLGACEKPTQWTGLWHGPEGTFVDIAKDGGGYRITIKNLDSARTFQGTAQGNRILFERDGVAEAIRPGTGAQTGMKWLSDKKDCLIVKPGEGYCRA
ncbi:MAG: hypothetical protein V4792_17595 [Pseudomonadota bacterium]